MKAMRPPAPFAGRILFRTTLSLLLLAGPLGADPLTDAANMWADSLRLEQNSDYAGALDKMSYFAKVSTDSYLYQVRCGWLNYLNKNYAQAAQSYQAAAKIEPAALTPYLGLIYTYQASGQSPAVLEACHEVLQRDPLNYTATKILAAISYDKGDFPEAARNYQALLRLYPEDVTLLSGAGWSLLRLDKKPEARLCFERLLLLSPNYSYANDGYEAARNDTSTQ